MEKHQIDKIIGLGKKHISVPADEYYLDIIENNLYKVLEEDTSNEKAREVLAKFLFERKKYKKSITQFQKLLENNDKKIRAYYGLYKSYLMSNDYVNSYKNLTEYVKNKENSKLIQGTKIIFSAYEIIFNNNYSYKIDETDYFIMNEIKDNELQIKYKKLVEAYNLQDYQQCLILAEECEEICRSKKILIEFSTFKKLLKKVNKVTQKFVRDNLNSIYEDLKKAAENNDFIKIIQLLNTIPNLELANTKFVYNAVYILIKNNYIEEAKSILNRFIKTRKNKIIIDTLYNSINNQIEYNNLSEIQKYNYQTAIEEGKQYYQEGNLGFAYYTYTFGQYTTNSNIFLYYIGKMLFKAKQYDEAEQYFKEYLKAGSDKISKAYLYLASIYRIKRNHKKALYYAEYIDILNEIFLTSFEMCDIYYSEKPYDYLKMKIQQQYITYDEFFNDVDNELYIQIKNLLQNGNIETANRLIKNLEQNHEKTEEDKRCLILINKNKKLYQNQNK